MLAPQMKEPGGNRALGNNVTTDPMIIAQDTEPGQSDAHLYALALRAGCHLLRLADGEFLLSKYGLSKACPDARSVRALLGPIGGAA